MYLYFSVGMYITTVLSHSDSYLYWCLAYIREGISDLRIYVAVTSPYPQDWGVTVWNWSSSNLYDEIESWSKSSRFYDSLFSSIWLEVPEIVKNWVGRVYLFLRMFFNRLSLTSIIFKRSLWNWIINFVLFSKSVCSS